MTYVCKIAENIAILYISSLFLVFNFPNTLKSSPHINIPPRVELFFRITHPPPPHSQKKISFCNKMLYVILNIKMSAVVISDHLILSRLSENNLYTKLAICIQNNKINGISCKKLRKCTDSISLVIHSFLTLSWHMLLTILFDLR